MKVKMLDSCRICGSSKIDKVDDVRFYDDVICPIYDCKSCGSRFAASDPDLYEQFHTADAHYYTKRMRAWTDQAVAALSSHDDALIRDQLTNFHFAMPHVLDTAERIKAESILEAGCAWGYNLSYFIHKKKQVLGVDISAAAIDNARNAFGDHFCTVDDPRYLEHAPFDLAFHFGTIGCVSDPIAFTRVLLDNVRPGGALVFNAPSNIQCEQLESPWIWGACPPDLVTLFSQAFWKDNFSDIAEIKTEQLYYDAATSWALRRQSRRAKQPARGSLIKPAAGLPASKQTVRSTSKKIFNIAVGPFVRRVVNPFGTIVTMTKK